MSFEEIMEAIEKEKEERKKSIEEYEIANKGKQTCDDCQCTYESCSCCTPGGRCAYE